MLVDAKRRPLGCRLWSAIRFTPAEQRRWHAGQAIDVLLRHNVVTGATLAFRAEYRDLVLPIPGGWVHDGWLALLIAAVADTVAIAEPLIEYRQHAAQQTGVSISSKSPPITWRPESGWPRTMHVCAGPRRSRPLPKKWRIFVPRPGCGPAAARGFP
jgi:hypothetical protein